MKKLILTLFVPLSLLGKEIKVGGVPTRISAECVELVDTGWKTKSRSPNAASYGSGKRYLLFSNEPIRVGFYQVLRIDEKPETVTSCPLGHPAAVPAIVLRAKPGEHPGRIHVPTVG